MLLKPARLASLKAAGLKTISVSLDGLEADHDALRRCSGAFRRVTAAIRAAGRRPASRTRFDVICCVNKLNIDRLRAVHRRSSPRSAFRRVRFTPVFSRGRANAEVGTDAVRRANCDGCSPSSPTSGQTRNDIVVTLCEEGYWGPNWECRVRDGFHYCASGVGIGTILHDGAVTGCPSVSRRFVEGASARGLVPRHLGTRLRALPRRAARAGAGVVRRPAGIGSCARAEAATSSIPPTPRSRRAG